MNHEPQQLPPSGPAQDDRHDPPGRPAGKRILPPLLFVLVLLVAALVRFAPGSRRQQAGPDHPYTISFPVLGTYASVKFWGPEKTAEDAASRIAADLYELHRTLNLFDPKSELSRLNRDAAREPFACSPLMWSVLTAAREAWQETDGAFDVTVGPLMELWGFHRKRETLPSEADVRTVLERVGFDKVILDERKHTVRFRVPGMRLDFGGIAKGFALDRCVAIARKAGVRRGLIDLGGNIFCLDEPPPGRPSYEIGVRDPFDPRRICGVVAVRNAAIATSGNYEQYVVIDGRRYTHIVDPRTGRPVPDVAAVTVITDRGVDSDVFSTAIFVRGAPEAEVLLKRHPRSRVLRISAPAGGSPSVETWNWTWQRPPAPGWLKIPEHQRDERSGKQE